MSAKKRSFYKLSLTVVLFWMVSFSAVGVYGQTGSQQPLGVPDDWTHHHVIFSDPGTAADALAHGRFVQWYRIVNDPRYIIQERRRRHKPPPPHNNKPLHRDWSMNMGAIAATRTGTVTTNNASGSPQSSVTISSATLGTVTLNASPPVAATQTGSFSALPTSPSATITIVNGANTLTATTNASGAYQTGTFSKPPLSTTSISITSGANTLAMTTNATASNVIGTFSTPPTTTTSISITSGSNTLALTTNATTGTYANLTFTGNAPTTGTISITYTGGASSNTLVMTAGTSNSCSSSTAGTFTANTNNSTTRATNLTTAIGMCPAAAGITASRNTTRVTLTARLPGAFLTTVTNSLTNTTNGTLTTGGNGSSICPSSTTGTFATSNSTATLASNLSTAIGMCSAAAGVTASPPSGSTVTVTDTTPGSLATSAFSVTAANNTGIFSWGTVSNGTDGSNACSSSTAGYFATSSNTTTLATNLAAAINLCPAAAGVSATPSTNTILATDRTLGSGTTFSGAVANATGIFVWSGFNAGNNGTANACTGSTTANYQYSSTLSTVASNLSAAINLCSAADGITSTPNGSGVTLTARTAGTSGNSISLTGNGVFAWTAGTLFGGTDGTTSGTSFAYWSGAAAVSTTQLATNLATAINANPTLQGAPGVAATSSGSVVTLIANSNGATGNSINLSVTSFSGFAWAGSALSGGSQGGGTVGPGIYPAKYEFYSNVANCDNAATPDFVVYNTGLAGSATQPTIVAYDNLYTGCSTASVPVPNVYWQYYTGGTIKTNPILSADGKQVAFVQSNASNQAQLVLLKWSDDTTIQSLSSVASGSAYQSCSAPCMYAITFDTTGAGIPNDTYSSPFYDYADDAIYVGDDHGYVHRFGPVFIYGAPQEDIGGGWPVQASVAPLSSPVYDFNSTLVFVGPHDGASGASARMHSITTTGTLTVINSGSMAPLGNANIMYADAPLVDPSAEQVYVFTNADAAGTSAAVWQIPYNFTTNQVGTEAAVGQGSTANPLYVGAFDNIYNSASGPVGNLYVCGRDTASQEPALWRIPINTTMGTPVEIGALATAATNCSPITEFYNTSTSTDYIFLSVQASSQTASPISCPVTPTGCIMSFAVNSALAANAATTATLGAAGGTSGIIIDNSVGSGTLAGSSQVYFTPLGSQACGGNSAYSIYSAGTAGVGTGGCAVQASQSGLQ